MRPQAAKGRPCTTMRADYIRPYHLIFRRAGLWPPGL